MTKKTIALVRGGFGPESKISSDSAEAVSNALNQLAYNHFPVEADHRMTEILISKKPDIVFLAVHGLYGEDGLLQSICEHLKIPYTGSGVLASSLCMDKFFLKKYLLKNHIPTPDFHLVDQKWTTQKVTQYPVVVKSSHGGSSLGTYIVKEEKDLLPAIEKAKKIGGYVFIEDYISKGIELSVSFLDGQILTPLEIEPNGDFYDFKRKYTQGESSYYIPPRIDPFVIEKIKFLAKKVFQLTGVRSYARADFLLQKEKTLWLLEVNTLPGLTENSILPKTAKHMDISFTDLIKKIIGMARTDYNI